MNKLLLISGSSSLGNSIITEFLKKKYSIVSTFNKKKIKISNKKLIKIHLDIEKDESINFFKKRISKKKFNYLIFCTGLIYGKNFANYDKKNVNKIFNINFIDIFEVFKKLIYNLKKNALVVFLSSISSEQGSYDPYYASSKAALNMMVRNLTRNYSNKFRLLSISPSLIKNTKMYRGMTKKNIKIHKDKNPQKTLLNKNDLAKILIDIHQAHWKKLNGINLNINGGL